MQGKELKVLPGMVTEEDGTEQETGQLTEQERGQLREQISRKISENMSAYYSVHKEEWTEFAGLILQEKGRAESYLPAIRRS